MENLIKVLTKNTPTPRIFHDFSGEEIVKIKEISSALYSETYYDDEGEEKTINFVRFKISYENKSNRNYRVSYCLSLYDADGACIYRWKPGQDGGTSLFFVTKNSNQTITGCKIDKKFQDLKAVDSTSLEIDYCAEIKKMPTLNFNYNDDFNFIENENSENNLISKLGYLPEKDNLDLSNFENKSISNYFNFTFKETSLSKVSKIDFRNYNGKNYITEVKNQYNCGACVSFACCAALESEMLLKYDKTIDLAEAYLHFCLSGKKCSEGNWVHSCLDSIKNYGVIEELNFLYTPNVSNCQVTIPNSIPNYKINSYETIESIESMVFDLCEKPLIGVMAVYDDFFNYSTGIYKTSQYAKIVGYHAILVIGFDIENQYWICKNSWGKNWGENGYFRIHFSSSGISTKMWKIN